MKSEVFHPIIHIEVFFLGNSTPFFIKQLVLHAGLLAVHWQTSSSPPNISQTGMFLARVLICTFLLE